MDSELSPLWRKTFFIVDWLFYNRDGILNDNAIRFTIYQ